MSLIGVLVVVVIVAVVAWMAATYYPKPGRVVAQVLFALLCLWLLLLWAGAGYPPLRHLHS